MCWSMTQGGEAFLGEGSDSWEDTSYVCSSRAWMWGEDVLGKGSIMCKGSFECGLFKEQAEATEAVWVMRKINWGLWKHQKVNLTSEG